MIHTLEILNDLTAQKSSSDRVGGIATQPCGAAAIVHLNRERAAIRTV